MKKSIIATGAASLALAAMPVVGAFAAVQSSVTDTVKVTINGACSVGTGADSQTGTGNLFEETMTNNTTKEWAADSAGSSIKVSCNDASGWNIKAQGTSTATVPTSMDATGTGTDIATGTSGTNSYWAFQVTGTGSVSAFNSWHIVPSDATVVASGSGAVSEQVVKTGYKVYVGATQQADVYTGKVTYTVAAGQS